MKTFFKVFLTILALLAIATYLVCSTALPEQTKAFTENVGLVLNYPITIAGVSVTIGGVASYIIVKYVMNMTKFGRKELDNIKADNSQYIEHIDAFRDDMVNKMDDMKAQYETLKIECNNQATIMLEQFESTQKMVLESLKTIPNKKVQAIVAQYESTYQEKKVESIDKVIHSKEYIDNQIKKLEEMLNEAKEILNSETKAA